MNRRERRLRASRRAVVAWYVQVPVVLAISAVAVARTHDLWLAIPVVYLNVISVWTGIESALARRNADLD